MVDPLEIKFFPDDGGPPVLCQLPNYALWPLASDAAYRSLVWWGDVLPERVEVEIRPAVTFREQRVAVALTCYILGAQGLQITYPVTCDSISGAANDCWASLSAGRGTATYEVMASPNAGIQLTVPLPRSQRLNPLIDSSYGVGRPPSHPLVVLEEPVLEKFDEVYLGDKSEEAMGSLHGEVCWCHDMKALWLHVQDFLPLEATTASQTQVIVDPTNLGPMLAMTLSRGKQLIGLVHNHLIQKREDLRVPAPSLVDVNIMRRVLYYAHQISLTINVGTYGTYEEAPQNSRPLAYYHLAWARGTIVTQAGFLVHSPGFVRNGAAQRQAHAQEHRGYDE